VESAGAALGSTFGESRNVSFDQTLLLIVDPRNNPPFFKLAACQAQVQETIYFRDKVVLPNMLWDIGHGGWRERDNQTLVFHIEQTAGPRDVVYAFEVACTEVLADGVGCDGGNGSIKFYLMPERWGNITLNITVKDSGGGTDTYFDTLELTVLPVNNPPSFLLNYPTLYTLEKFSDLCCDHVVVVDNFASQISLGPWEDARTIECQRDIPCEHQRGTFIITSLNQTVSDLLFAAEPHLHFNGSLTFVLRVNANSDLFGIAKFAIRLQDGESIDGVPQHGDKTRALCSPRRIARYLTDALVSLMRHS